MTLATRVVTKRVHQRVRILTIDIETSPNLALVWGLWNQNIGLHQLLSAGRVISFAAKWYGDKRVEFRSDHHDGHEAMIRRAWELLDEADVVIHYNGDQFDLKHLNREFAVLNLDPPRPARSIDLLKVVRRRFRFASAKLDHVARELGIGHKVEHPGFEMWLGCMNGDPAAWALMRKYNIGDVKLTERLFERILSWIVGTVHLGVIAGDNRDHPATCPNCGSPKIKRDGWVTTNQTRWAAYRCMKCGTPIRNTKYTNRASSRRAL